MIGYDTHKGYEVEPLDDRDEDEPDFEINPILSSPNTDFGGDDPADTQPFEGRVGVSPLHDEEDLNPERYEV